MGLAALDPPYDYDGARSYRDAPPLVHSLDNAGSSGYDNILQSGSRRLRFDQLMDSYRGAIDAEAAKTILADHYDVYQHADFACGRTICGHFDRDDSRFGGGHGPY